jgi:hypothetical protein
MILVVLGVKANGDGAAVLRLLGASSWRVRSSEHGNGTRPPASHLTGHPSCYRPPLLHIKV